MHVCHALHLNYFYNIHLDRCIKQLYDRIRRYKLNKMDINSLINVIFLCLLNTLFMIGGIVLNLVVIISLWRSTQLRRKLCYFTIFVLSCFDLAVVAIAHPILLLSTTLWSMAIYHEQIRITRIQTVSVLGGFSMFALLTLNAERFLALQYPFFHQSSVTKRKLTYFLALLITNEIAVMQLYYFLEVKKNINMLIAVFLTFVFFIFIYINYKVFTIAKSKREDERVASFETSERPKYKIHFKSISGCSLAVGCFFICCSPQLIYSIWRLLSNTSRTERQALLFSLWCNTVICMNSTFNCVIFFWRNSILRCEGMKTLKYFISAKKRQVSYS